MLGGSLDGRGVWGRMYTCIYTQGCSLFTEPMATFLIGYTPIQKEQFKRKKREILSP